MPSRCSDFPGGATHFGSGWAANSLACSALLRNAETMISAMPSSRAAAFMRSKASAVSGRIGLPCLYANGPRYSPSPPVSGRPICAGGASSASARALIAASWWRPPASLVAGSRTVTRICVGANVSPSGNSTSTSRAPFARATPRAASRPSVLVRPHLEMACIRLRRRSRVARTGACRRRASPALPRARRGRPRAARARPCRCPGRPRRARAPPDRDGAMAATNSSTAWPDRRATAPPVLRTDAVSPCPNGRSGRLTARHQRVTTSTPGASSWARPPQNLGRRP